MTSQEYTRYFNLYADDIYRIVLSSCRNPVTLYYQTETYAEEDGSSSEQESVLWNDGNNYYNVSGYNLDLISDQWFTLAKSLL